MFYKKCVPRNFTKFTGKHLYQSLFFNKVAGLRSVTLLKKRLLYRCFPANFVKFLRTHFFKEHLWTTASFNSVTWILIWIHKAHFKYMKAYNSSYSQSITFRSSFFLSFVNYFCKKLHLRCLPRFWIRLWFHQYQIIVQNEYHIW